MVIDVMHSCDHDECFTNLWTPLGPLGYEWMPHDPSRGPSVHWFVHAVLSIIMVWASKMSDEVSQNILGSMLYKKLVDRIYMLEWDTKRL